MIKKSLNSSSFKDSSNHRNQVSMTTFKTPPKKV